MQFNLWSLARFNKSAAKKLGNKVKSKGDWRSTLLLTF